MSENVSIKVSVAGKEYPLKVSVGEHKLVMELEKEIEERLQELKTNYGVKDKQDLLAMFLFQYMMLQKGSSENKKSQSNSALIDDGLLEKLKDLEGFVSDYLKS